MKEEKQMLLSTQTGYMMQRYGEIGALRRLKAAGFDAIDFSYFFYPLDGPLLSSSLQNRRAFFKDIKQAADEEGIVIGQIHAPFPHFNGEASDDWLFNKVAQSMSAADVLGASYNVVHPKMIPGELYPAYYEDGWNLNREYFTQLIPYAQEADVKIAIENIFAIDRVKKVYFPTCASRAKELNQYIDHLNDIAQEERFVACLDTGHALIIGDTPQNMIGALGPRLKVLHVQDNNGMQDQHLMPYMGMTNWNKVTAALRRSHYTGSFNFEADTLFSITGTECEEAALSFLQSVGRSLIHKIES